MLRKPIFWIFLPLLLVVAAACSGAAPTPTVSPLPPTETAALSATPTEAAALPTDTLPPPTPTVEEAPPTAAGPDAAEIAGRPAEPAPPDVFRSDPATLVGATGNPQLLEFFTYW